MTFGSLFAGIGGLDLGLERAGMVCKWQVEIEDYATKVLERHWPNVPRWRDVRTFPPNTDSDTLRKQSGRRCGSGREGTAIAADNGEQWQVELVCGGFPCQDISSAGQRRGITGERSSLFSEAVRVADAVGARWLLLENVAALLSRGMGTVLAELAEVGFDAEWHCIPAAAIGAPHIRDRIFILGYRNYQRESASTINDEALGMSKFSTIIRSDWWDVEPQVGRMAHGIPRRVDRLRCLGNAVVPQVAEYIGRQIMATEVD